MRIICHMNPEAMAYICSEVFILSMDVRTKSKKYMENLGLECWKRHHEVCTCTSTSISIPWTHDIYRSIIAAGVILERLGLETAQCCLGLSSQGKKQYEFRIFLPNPKSHACFSLLIHYVTMFSRLGFQLQLLDPTKVPRKVVQPATIISR